MKQMNLFLKAWNDFKSLKAWLVLFSFVDFIFVILYSSVFIFMQLKVVQKLSVVSQMTNDNLKLASETVETQSGMLEIMNKQQAILSGINEVVQLVLMLVVSLFFVWVLFQGFNYLFLGKKLAGKRKYSFWKKCAYFVGYNFIVGGILVFLLHLFLRFLVFNQNVLLELINQNFALAFFGFILFAVYYIVYVGHILILKENSFMDVLKNQFIVSFTNIKDYGVRYVFSFLLVLLVFVVFALTFNLMHSVFSVAYILVVFGPVFTFLRTLMIAEN